MNEGYSEIANVINRIKKKKIELESLLTKYRNTTHTQKIMDAVLKVEGILTKAKKLQMSINVKSYTSAHQVSSGILHSKLLKEISQITSQEQEIEDIKNRLEELVTTPEKESVAPKNVAKAKKTQATSWEIIDIPDVTEDYDNQTGEEFISYAKTSHKAKESTKYKSKSTKEHYKAFEAPLSDAQRKSSLEIQDMLSQFRAIRNDLDSVLSSYRGQKYRKRTMDLIIKVKADINTLLSLQSSFKILKSNAINHSATVNRANVANQLNTLKSEKQEILEKKKILKAKIAKEKKEQKEYKPKKKPREKNIRVQQKEKEKETKMVNLLLKMGVLKKKEEEKK